MKVRAWPLWQQQSDGRTCSVMVRRRRQEVRQVILRGGASLRRGMSKLSRREGNICKPCVPIGVQVVARRWADIASTLFCDVLRRVKFFFVYPGTQAFGMRMCVSLAIGGRWVEADKKNMEHCLEVLVNNKLLLKSAISESVASAEFAGSQIFFSDGWSSSPANTVLDRRRWSGMSCRLPNAHVHQRRFYCFFFQTVRSVVGFRCGPSALGTRHSSRWCGNFSRT